MPAALLCLLFAAPAPFAKSERQSDVHDAFTRLQGNWTPYASYRWQEDAWVRVYAAGHPLVIRGGCFAWQGSHAPKALVETFTLHRGPYPRGIDFVSPYASGVERAAYTLYADTLTIVLPYKREERPSFERGRYKLVYRRMR
jgi:hypothetical protein